ncbi:MAG: flagellar biosynthetic protein FliR [Oligoflexus sp.]
MFNLPYQVALEGALVFIRVSGILFAMPVFGDQSTPIRVRILLSAAIAFLIYPMIESHWVRDFPKDLLGFFVLVLKELMIGLLIGYVAKLAMEALTAAATIVGFQMGFGMANMVMPNADYMMDAFTAFHRSLIILFFLALDLHHIYISAIVDTFRAIPSGEAIFRAEIGSYLIRITSDLFIIAIKLAAPVLIALLFAMAALGLIARTVPQVQVFVLSFPISFFIGLLVYIATIPFFPQWIKLHFSVNQQQIFTIIRGMIPS